MSFFGKDIVVFQMGNFDVGDRLVLYGASILVVDDVH